VTLLWRLGRYTLDCSEPRIMAIANAAPDSFYDGSRLPQDRSGLRRRLEELIAAGPDILDIGGQSTRPGSARVGADEELARVLPALELARELAPELPVTIDTYSAPVARATLAAGAAGINDISAGELEPELWDVLAASDCGYVAMHMQGTPESMQQSPSYCDAAAEVGEYLSGRLAELERRGVDRERVVLDPGIGFGKRLEDNLELIRKADALQERVGRPLLYGVSRKSFIGRLDESADTAAARLPGTLGVTWELLRRGVMLHRVHDVAAVRQLMRVWSGVRS
jgi:dihydropteroate synthase